MKEDLIVWLLMNAQRKIYSRRVHCQVLVSGESRSKLESFWILLCWHIAGSHPRYSCKWNDDESNVRLQARSSAATSALDALIACSSADALVLCSDYHHQRKEQMTSAWHFQEWSRVYLCSNNVAAREPDIRRRILAPTPSHHIPEREKETETETETDAANRHPRNTRHPRTYSPISIQPTNFWKSLSPEAETSALPLIGSGMYTWMIGPRNRHNYTKK